MASQAMRYQQKNSPKFMKLVATVRGYCLSCKKNTALWCSTTTAFSAKMEQSLSQPNREVDSMHNHLCIEGAARINRPNCACGQETVFGWSFDDTVLLRTETVSIQCLSSREIRVQTMNGGHL